MEKKSPEKQVQFLSRLKYHLRLPEDHGDEVSYRKTMSKGVKDSYLKLMTVKQGVFFLGEQD